MSQEPLSSETVLEKGRFAYQSKLADFVKVLFHWYPPEEIVLIGTALVVGLGTGFGAVVFIWLLGQIGVLSQMVRNVVGEIPGLLLVMTVGGLIVGYIVDYWAKEAKGHGVPEVMEAIAIKGGRIRARVAALKVLASAVTIGTGGSAGREGPIVQVGSALGSTLAQMLHFSNERMRTLVACGSAAGIAATFNAPIAGAIFALEVVLGSFTVRYFGAVVISSVSASVVSRAFLSDKPAFAVPAYPLNHLGELPIYVLLGVLSALVAVAFIRLLYRLEGLFDDWEMPQSVKSGLGMGIAALVALALPAHNQVLGPGLHLIGEAIAENFNLSMGLMGALLILKLLTTSFTLGSGNSGGVFAPSLFMGAVLGGAVGSVAHSIWPNVAANPGAYAIVGMAAVFAGAARAPITAILIVFEMSNDYQLILPLMLATVLATFLAEALCKESIYTMKLKLKGISLHGGRDVDVLQGVTVQEIMAKEIHTVSSDMTLTQLSDMFSETRRHGFLVLDTKGKLWGIVTIADLDRAVAEDVPRSTTVAEIGTPQSRLVVAYPDETMGEALARMGVRGFGRLPVVARDDTSKLEGLIRREEIIRAYNMALARRAELQHRAKRVQLRNLDGTEFVDIALGETDRAVGQMVQEFSTDLPKDCILISVRRKGNVLIPHGSTTFQPGDLVTAFIRTQDVEELYQLMKG